MKKKILFAAIPLLVLSAAGIAQEKEVIRKGNKEITITKDGDKETKVTVEMNDDAPANNQKTETREIIIRKNGDKETRMMVEINGDDVMINGKPMNEFKEDGVNIRKKKMIIVNGEPLNSVGNDIIAPDSFLIQGLGNMDGNMLFIDGNFNTNESTTEKTDTVAFLGVSTEPDEKGVRITEIVAGSAAEKSGLLKDDLITAVDGKTITDPQGLTSIIRKHKPKDKIKINFLRNGKNKTEAIALQEKVMQTNIKKRVIIRRDDQGNQPETFNFAMPNIGEWTEGFPFPKKQKLGLKIQDTEAGDGVKVLEVEPESPAAKSGLMKEDKVIAIGGIAVTNTDEAREQLQENADKNLYEIKVIRNGKEMNIEVKIPKKLKTADL